MNNKDSLTLVRTQRPPGPVEKNAPEPFNPAFRIPAGCSIKNDGILCQNKDRKKGDVFIPTITAVTKRYLRYDKDGRPYEKYELT